MHFFGFTFCLRYGSRLQARSYFQLADIKYIWWCVWANFRFQYNNQKMTNNKSRKRVVNYGTQFSSTDIYFEEQEANSKNQIAKIQIALEKEEEHFLSQNQGRNSSSASKQQKDERRSLNHNFQKHAVVTIKKLMKMKYDANASLQEKVAHKMWNIFMVSEIKSKKLLVILFGNAALADQRNRKLFLKCGFEEILQQGQILIRKAQEILRKKVVETVTEEIVQQNIQNFRNIKAREEFLVYFSELLNLLRKGPLVKLRINNRSAKRIEAEINSKKAVKPALD